MSWFTRKRTDGTVANDGLNALDRLTQKASVDLSRRSFLKKAGIGLAGVGAALTVKEASACSLSGGECHPPVRSCVSCPGGLGKVKTTYYRWHNCNGVQQCLVYQTVTANTCTACAH